MPCAERRTVMARSVCSTLLVSWSRRSILSQRSFAHDAAASGDDVFQMPACISGCRGPNTRAEVQARFHAPCRTLSLVMYVCNRLRNSDRRSVAGSTIVRRAVADAAIRPSKSESKSDTEI